MLGGATKVREEIRVKKMEYDELLKASEELLFYPEFKELEAELAFPEPNIWQILGTSRKETLITRFLAWLLNPQSQHSFGSRFLKNIVVGALQTDKGRQEDLSPVEVAVMDLSAVEVRTEYWLDRRRCDILVYSKQNCFLCLVENKIGATESKEQTRYYYKHSFIKFAEGIYPKRVYIYLSPGGTLPESEHFIPLSYQAILDGLKRLLTNQQKTTETERFLLYQFQESLRRSVAMDQKTLDLAQAIYEKYGTVVKFIYENAEKPDTDVDAVWDEKSWFFNIGEVGATPYSWGDCREYSFICAGGGKRYRQWMQNFKVGDTVYAYVSESGYVGIGIVAKTAVPFRETTLSDGRKLMDLQRDGKLTGTHYNYSDNDETCDWVALVEWEKAVEKAQAVQLEPIVPATASRVYEHRKALVEQVRQGLGV